MKSLVTGISWIWLIQSSVFVPQEGILYSDLDFGPVHAQAVTFMYARGSLLVEHYEFDHPVDFTGFMAPGVWVEEGWDTNPFYSVHMDSEHATGTYDLGETHGRYFMKVEPSATAASTGGQYLHAACYWKQFYQVLCHPR